MRDIGCSRIRGSGGEADREDAARSVTLGRRETPRHRRASGIDCRFAFRAKVEQGVVRNIRRFLRTE